MSRTIKFKVGDRVVIVSGGDPRILDTVAKRGCSCNETLTIESIKPCPYRCNDDPDCPGYIYMKGKGSSKHVGCWSLYGEGNKPVWVLRKYGSDLDVILGLV